MKTHTPGPWQWFARPNGDIYLATPHSGHLIVMDFIRKGSIPAIAPFLIFRKGGS